MRFSDEGRVVENKMLNAVVEQGGFVAAFTGERPDFLTALSVTIVGAQLF